MDVLKNNVVIKKCSIHYLLFLFLFFSCVEQKTNDSYPIDKDNITFSKGSGISDIEIMPTNVKTLKDLGLIWGFLKYYHPEIAKGTYDWDNELFKITPQLIAESNQAKRDSIFVEWINGLGTISTSTKTIDLNKKNIKLTPDWEWITNSGFSPQLVDVLEKVKNAKRPDVNYYVTLIPHVGNPEFKNEKSYGDMKYPDMGYRILALYRYWNIIQYYFPYKNLIEEDWKNVLEEFIPYFISAQNATEYVLSVLELIGRIHDTHANIWGHLEVLEIYKGRNYATPKITFIEDKAVITGFYDKYLGMETNLKIGDVITEIDGEKIEDIIQKRLKITPASNYPTQLRNIAKDLLRTNEKAISISYISKDTLNSKELTTYSSGTLNPYCQESSEKPAFEILANNIGYLYPGSLEKGEIDALYKDIKATKGLIIDLRCYPSDFIVFSLGGKLVPKPTPFVKFSSPSITTPGLFTMSKPLSVCEHFPLYDYISSIWSNYYKEKIVILINEETQSQAEYTTMAFRVAPNATVIGSTTAGADGNVSVIVLPGNIQTMISGIGIYYPDGRETQRIGIIPDIEIKPTIKGITEGRDELLEKAIEWIKEE